MRRRRIQNDSSLSQRFIADCEKRISRQKQLIAWLNNKGKPSKHAEQALREFERTLLQLQNHSVLMQNLVSPD